VRVAFSDDPRDFVRRDWSALMARDPDATFFHTPAYLKLYWEEFGAEASLFLAFAEEEDTPGPAAGVAGFERSGAVLRFLGGTEVTDFMGPVAEPAAADRVAKELMCALEDIDGWTTAELGGLVETSGWASRLTDACRDAGFEVILEDDRNGVAPLLALPDSYEDYLAALPARLRHEIRRKARRLEGEAGEIRMIRATSKTLPADLDRFVALHQASEGPKGRFMQPGMEIFFRRLGEAFLPGGVFRLSFLEIGGERAAGAIGFGFKDVFSLYNSAFDRRWSSLSPGMVLVSELIRSAIEDGFRRFDFLKGDLAYKYRFGAVPRSVRRLRLRR
jgi:CelD/BcsL family acetyltransferase involved in cellulose biosynthesis